MAIPIDATFTGEASLALLVGLTLLFRVAGAAARAVEAAPARLYGWLLCAVAGWLAVAAAGGFAPLGLALLLGLLFAFVDHFGNRLPARAAGDLLIVGGCCAASIPVPAIATAVTVATAVMLAGLVLDLLVARLQPAGSGARRAAVALLSLAPLLLWVGHGLALPQQRAAFLQEKLPQFRPALGPFLAVARAEVGEPVELPGGATGWLTLPPGPPPYRPALFFHGADEEGSYQRSALYLRRALRGLGYAVLALDAPGFAASAPPAPLRDIDAWDPEPVSVAAARYLAARPDVEGSVLAVGHSMGATRALRFVDVWTGASAAIILGATVMPPESENERLYGRLLDDFDLEESGLPRRFVLRVRQRYFNNDVAATSLRPGHAPVLFVRFAYDYENIVAGREELFRMIPGRKVVWELRTDHQLGSSRVLGVLVGDWQLMRRITIGVRRFVDGRAPRSDAELPFTPRR